MEVQHAMICFVPKTVGFLQAMFGVDLMVATDVVSESRWRLSRYQFVLILLAFHVEFLLLRYKTTWSMMAYLILDFVSPQNLRRSTRAK